MSSHLHHLKSTLRRTYWGDELNGKCFCCGRSLYFDDAHIGHVISKKNKGTGDVKNLRLICQTCNHGMGSKNMDEYMKEIYPERYTRFFVNKEGFNLKEEEPLVAGYMDSNGRMKIRNFSQEENTSTYFNKLKEQIKKVNACRE